MFGECRLVVASPSSEYSCCFSAVKIFASKNPEMLQFKFTLFLIMVFTRCFSSE